MKTFSFDYPKLKGIDAEILDINLSIFKHVMPHVKTSRNPSGILSLKYALKTCLHLTDEDIAF